MSTTLNGFITNKGFDAYNDTLATKCEVEGIDFHSEYSKDSFTIWMNFGNIPATTKISTGGLMSFTYFKGGRKMHDDFIDCTASDFELLNDKAFIYLRDGDINTHQDWYNNLKKLAV